MLCAASQKVGCTELAVQVIGDVRSKSGDQETTATATTCTTTTCVSAQPLHWGLRVLSAQPLHWGLRVLSAQPLHWGLRVLSAQPLHWGLRVLSAQPLHWGLRVLSAGLGSKEGPLTSSRSSRRRLSLFLHCPCTLFLMHIGLCLLHFTEIVL